MSLHDRALAGFDAALAATLVDPSLDAVRAAIAGQREHYRRKMSVALVGRVSSGKSTLANALLGGGYAATGIEELTYNVTVLRHGSPAKITAHFYDRREPERWDRGELRRLTVRAHDDPELQEYLTAISYLEVVDPNPRLEPFDLVDTPGLDGVSGSARSRGTFALLGRTDERVRADTVTFAEQADALLLVFSRALAGTDAEVVGEFVRAGLGAANPITAVGALTKIELYWPHEDPLRKGREDADRLMSAPHARRLLFELKPVAGKLAAAAAVFTERDYEDLCALKTVPLDTLERRLRFGPGFKREPYPDLPLPAERRSALFDLFSGYGVHLASELIRKEQPDLAQLRTLLEERSGLSDLRRLLSDHFARRADLIKLRRVIDQAGTLPARFAAGLLPRELDLARRAVAGLTDLALDPAFRELDVLRRHYQGDSGFSEQEGLELIRLAGERGPAFADRLGLPADTGLEAMAALAAERHAHWSAAVIDPDRIGDLGACRVMLGGYDRIIHELDEARRAATAEAPTPTPEPGATPDHEAP